jgi:pimeloyl-ACP methyl ester carboxylesterase
LIEQLRLQDIVLVGAGFGGWIASEMAVRTTERLERLVLVSPFGIKVGSRDDRDFADFYSISPDERAALEFKNSEFAELSYVGKSEEELTILARGRESEAYYGWEPFMHNPQLRQWLHRVKVPTTLIRGADDRVIARRNHDAYAEEIRDCKIVTIDGAGHHPHLDAPSAFVSAVQSAIKICKPSVVAI